jgi:PD-(D/E)XK nuclease superfamily
MTPGGASKRGSHRLSESAICQRKWYLHNALGLRPKVTPDYFIEGTLIHLVLAYHYAAKMKEKPQWLFETPLDVALAKEGKGYPDAIKLAKVCGQAYAKFYEHNDPWEPVAVEHEYVARVGDLRRMVSPSCADHPADNELVTSRIDLLVRVNGYLWHVDYKTTLHGRGRLPQYNPEGEYAVYWQFLVQTLILKKVLGADYRGMLVQRIYRKEPFDFDREVVSIPRRPYIDAVETIAERCLDENRIAKEAREAAASGRDMSIWLPRGNFWNCFSWGKPCEYRPICLAENDPALRECMGADFDAA